MGCLTPSRWWSAVLGIFFKWGWGGLERLIFAAVFNRGREKEGVCRWFFDGEIVVMCVVSVGF
jgi:hypothetical protein